MIHSEDKEGIIIADKLTRVAVDRRMHVYALHHCWLPSPVRRQIENFSNRDSAIVIHVILSPSPPLCRYIDRSLFCRPVNGRITHDRHQCVSAPILWFTAIDNIDNAYTLSTHASRPPRARPSTDVSIEASLPPSPWFNPFNSSSSRVCTPFFYPILSTLASQGEAILEITLDTPWKNGVWWIANKPTSLE